jgi:dipeptidyl aminopeptidase/acylaminoacyl peptidase
LTNIQQGINGSYGRVETPDRPFGGTGDYDISPDGQLVAWWSRNPDLPITNVTQSSIWLQPFDGSSEAKPINPLDGANTPPNARGYSVAPVFSPDSQYIAYFQMDNIMYEADRNKIYIASANVDSPNITVLAENWDRSPDTLKWAADGQSVFVSGPDSGHVHIFEVPLDAGADFTPSNITGSGSVVAFYVLPDENLLVSDTKVWSSRDAYIVSPEGEVTSELFKAYEVDAELEGLGPDIFREFYYPGNWTDIHALMVLPEGFDESQTYPLAYIIHGGPQSANANSWSTRWNFKVWADQGYVVVAPNPTGSIGFGQELTDMIQNNWGSYPYDDIVKGHDYIVANFPFIDTENGIEAGASYGGYMTNWIQGHDLGRKFKALVTHDGSTNTLSQYASEELFFMEHDFNGTLWDPEARPNYERYNPIDYAHNWATPHFVIHNTLDYRLPESEGIMLFNILQEKGVPSKFLNFPDENHWVLNRENSRVWHQQIFQWINYYSGISDESPF